MQREKNAEVLLKQVKDMEQALRKMDKRILVAALAAGPGSWHMLESGRTGFRRCGKSAWETSEYICTLIEKKDELIAALKLIEHCFELLKGSLCARVLYLRLGLHLPTQMCADRLGISRRHYQRKYVFALQTFCTILTQTPEGEKLLSQGADKLIRH